MKNLNSIGIVITCLFNSFCFGQLETKIDKELKQLYRDTNFSGIIHVQEGKDTLYSKTFGFRNFEEKTSINRNTRFNIGSMNKMFTVVAAVQIMDKYDISLEDTIMDALPKELKGIGLETITYKQLMTHTSGLGDYLTHRDYYQHLESYLDMQSFYKPEFFRLVSKPGINFQYSNSGVLLLGILLEQLEQEDYYNLIQYYVFDKAHMNRTGFYTSLEIIENRAVGYYIENDKIISNHYAHSIKGTPAGGSYSTINDLLKFFRCLTNGTLVNKELLDMMTEPIIKNPRSRRQSSYVGLIFSVDQESKNFGHSGGAPGISCYSRYFPEKKMTILILQNYGSSRSTRKVVENILRPWE